MLNGFRKVSANEIFSMHNNEIDQEAENNNENVPCTIMQIQANSRKRNEEISHDTTIQEAHDHF